MHLNQPPFPLELCYLFWIIRQLFILLLFKIFIIPFDGIFIVLLIDLISQLFPITLLNLQKSPLLKLMPCLTPLLLLFHPLRNQIILVDVSIDERVDIVLRYVRLVVDQHLVILQSFSIYIFIGDILHLLGLDIVIYPFIIQIFLFRLLLFMNFLLFLFLSDQII